jgi:hypothetical protein
VQLVAPRFRRELIQQRVLDEADVRLIGIIELFRDRAELGGTELLEVQGYGIFEHRVRRVHRVHRVHGAHSARFGFVHSEKFREFGSARHFFSFALHKKKK